MSKEHLMAPWQPGQSGNPSGRPRGVPGLAALARESTAQGRELIAFFLSVARGMVPSSGGRLRARRASRAQQMQAAEWLADRAFGKPIQTTDLNLGGFEGVDIRLLGPCRSGKEADQDDQDDGADRS